MLLPRASISEVTDSVARSASNRFFSSAFFSRSFYGCLRASTTSLLTNRAEILNFLATSSWL